MSKHGKKMKRIADWEAIFPSIEVDHDSETGSWVCWHFNAGQLRIEIALVKEAAELDDEVYLYVDGDPFELGRELSWEDAEVRYGAATRARLLLTHLPGIRAHEHAGLDIVREEATALGLLGTAERRQRTIKTTGHLLHDPLALDHVTEQEG